MSVMYTHRHAIKSNGCGTSRSRSNSPMLFSDGEGPAGLRDYDPSGKRPPSDWETGDYHPYNKFIQRCNEKLRERLVKLGCTQYKDGDEINFIFWRPVWRLHRNYDGDLRLCIFNYQTLEESRSMGDKHSWGALNGSGVLISKTPRTTRDLLSLVRSPRRQRRRAGQREDGRIQGEAGRILASQPRRHDASTAENRSRVDLLSSHQAGS